MRRDIFLSVLFSLLCGASSYAQLAIDVHSHIIPAEYTALLARHNAELEETFPLPRWDADSHLAFMDEAGIGCAILTLPAPQPFYGDVEESVRCIRQVNELSAQIKAQHPGRFKFCAALPLPDVEAAIHGHIDSVKNPRSGEIVADSVGEVILGDAVMECTGKVTIR